MAVEAIGGLRVLAVNILGRFLTHRDNNIRYVALHTLACIVAVDTQAVQRHRATIVECVKDADASIRGRALELVYALVNEGNVKTLTRELLDYLEVCDPGFKPDLAAKLCALVQKFAPDKRWYLDSMAQVLSQAGPHVKEEPCRALVLLITNTPQLHGYAARTFYKVLQARGAGAAPALLMVAIWCVGEYGEEIVSPSGLLERERRETVGEDDVVGLLASALVRPDLTPAGKEYLITALSKLSSRLPGSMPRIKALVEPHTSSIFLEVQTRSAEFVRLCAYDTIRPQVLEHIPPVEESAEDASLNASTDGSEATAAAIRTTNPAADLAALLGLDLVDAAAQAPSAAAMAPTAAELDPLEDLFAEQQAPITLTAFSKDGLTVSFAGTKPLEDPSQTDIIATFSNEGLETVTNFTLQAAVPKFMQVKLEPASSSTLPAGGAGSATQAIRVKNSMHGQKTLVMRLRISFSRGGQQVVEQAEVNGFPPGF
jgi:AP-1 complex subunit gamma-1